MDAATIQYLICPLISIKFDRFLWFLLIKKAEVGLKKVSEDNMEIIENKHILAYGK